MYATLEELKQAAMSGNAEAEYLYGAAISFDKSTLDTDNLILYPTWHEGVQWLRKAADKGEVNALVCMARIYETTGDTGKLNMIYNELSEKYNNPYGQYKLGKMYEMRGNLSKAYYYYNRAAMNGNKDAQFLMQYHNPDVAPIDKHPDKSYVIYGLLGVFIGGIGIHNFYAGQTKKGIIKVLMAITLVGALPSSLWGLFEGLNALFSKNIGD